MVFLAMEHASAAQAGFLHTVTHAIQPSKLAPMLFCVQALQVTATITATVLAFLGHSPVSVRASSTLAESIVVCSVQTSAVATEIAMTPSPATVNALAIPAISLLPVISVCLAIMGSNLAVLPRACLLP
jgi:hypothetical protein